MKKLMLIMTLLLLTIFISSYVTAYAADPGINENGGNNGNDWEWNSLIPSEEEI